MRSRAAGVAGLPVGHRIVTWDLKKGTIAGEHPVPKDSFRGAFFYREGPPLEWLPGRKGWLLYSQGLIDYRTVELAGVIPIEHEHRPHVVRPLTTEYGVKYDGREVQLIRMLQPKGG